jgi:CelD/BcsL family acetyltransferase involved in cellulose biosynthesis
MSSVRTYVLSGFLDLRCGPEQWERLLLQGDTRTVWQTWHWSRAWWESVGEGDLLLVAAERDGAIFAIAPLYARQGIIFFLGSGESDCLDFVGDVGDAETLAAMLTTAREHVPDFEGFNLYLVPERSRSGQRIEAAACRLGLECSSKEDVPAVSVDLVGQQEAVRAAIHHSMRKREKHFRHRGTLLVEQLSDVAAIWPHLDDFYAQHVGRWTVKPDASPLVQPQQRAILERFLRLAQGTGWVRFLRIEWQGRPLAFEFAWYFHGAHYSGPWCFAIEHARRSPGQVLLRQSVLAALAAGLHTYDLGLGDQEYKLRLPASLDPIRTWWLYPP